MNVVSAAVGAVTEVVAGAFAVASDALGGLIDICNNFPYNTETGIRLLRPTNIPTGKPPSGVIGVLNPVGNSFYNSQTKDEYDEFMFDLKEYTVPNSALSSLDRNNYNSSLSYLNAITRAYHDKISKTIDNSLDAQHQREFNASINDTLDKNTLWPSYIKSEFKNKADVISQIINNNAQTIRNFPLYIKSEFKDKTAEISGIIDGLQFRNPADVISEINNANAQVIRNFRDNITGSGDN